MRAIQAVLLVLVFAAAIFLAGCERHYHLVMDGNNNVVVVTAEVPKKIDASAEGQLDLAP